MKNYLSERVISALWFCILSFLFVSSIMSSYRYLAIDFIVAAIAFFIGFFHGYKILLLPADNLSIFVTRCVAGIWAAVLGFLLCLALPFPVGNAFKPNLNIEILYIIIIPIAFILGWRVGYKLFLFPKIKYARLFPTFIDRLISAIWFGLTGFAALRLQNGTITGDPSGLFIVMFAAYLGYSYGWRIIALPTANSSCLKALMIGFIGSSYALLIFLLIIFFNFYSFASIPPEFIEPPIINSLVDHLVNTTVQLCLVFSEVAWLTCGIGMILSLVLYFISRSNWIQRITSVKFDESNK